MPFEDLAPRAPQNGTHAHERYRRDSSGPVLVSDTGSLVRQAVQWSVSGKNPVSCRPSVTDCELTQIYVAVSRELNVSSPYSR